MRIREFCFTCAEEAGGNFESLEDSLWIFDATITDDFANIVTCPKGHKHVSSNEGGTIVLLFERALSRLVAGDTRDALLDGFTAFEMYVAAIPVRARYDRERSAQVTTIRHELRGDLKLAERSRGASQAVLSLISGEKPPKYPEGAANARNDAIHAGLYPTEAQTESHLLALETYILEAERILDSIPCVNAVPFWTAAFIERTAAEIKKLVAEGGVPRQQSWGATLALSKLSGIGRAKTAAERLRELRAGSPSFVDPRSSRETVIK